MQSPKRNWSAIISRSIGVLLIIYSFALFLGNGVVSLSMLSLGTLLIVATSVRDVIFGQNEKQVRREIKQRLAAKSGEATEPTPPTDEFFRRLGNESDFRR